MNKPLVLIVLLAFLAPSTKAQSLISGLSTNGPVYASERSGSKIYIAGNFDTVGYRTPYGIPIDTSTALPIIGSALTDSFIYAACPDGQGGFYIGGAFTKVNGYTRNNLAQINSSGQLTSWNPGTNGRVQSIVSFGDKVFIGGTFTTVAGTTRTLVAAISKTSGTVTSFNANATYSASLSVQSLTVIGNRLVAAGNFTNIGGQVRNRIAMLDTSTGLATTFNPDPNAAVLNVIPYEGKVYAGGAFTTIGGTSRNGLAALDTANGNATTWNPAPVSSGTVTVSGVAVANGKIFVSGNFTNVGGQPRNNLAALDTATGLATNFYAGITGSGIPTIMVAERNILYVGGNFTSIGGQPRNLIAALDTATGNATSWNPEISGVQVYALSISNGKLYAGGNYRMMKAKARKSMAAFDLGASKVLDFNPIIADGQVNTILFHGNRLYIGGTFTIAGGQTRNRIAAIDTSGAGTVLPFNPGADASVRALAAIGNKLYVGGIFSIVGGLTRIGVAAIDTATGIPTAWVQNANYGVTAMATSGSRLYLGGNFTSIGGVGRNYVACFDTASSFPTPWNPAINTSANILALLPYGNRIFVAGNVHFLGYGYGNDLFRADTITGTMSVTAASVGSSIGVSNVNTIFALAAKGSRLYYGGFQGLRAIDTGTLYQDLFNPSVFGSVNTLLSMGDTLYAGGGFTQINGSLPQSFLTGIPQPFFGAMLDVVPLPVTLYSFTAQKGTVGNTVLLNWKVGAERDLCCYGIERSTDGVSFREIGFVSAANRKDYNHTDNDAANGMNYYRIRMQDKNGTVRYSATATVVLSSKGSIAATPVPTRGVVTVTNTDASLNGLQAEILNLQGQIIKRFSLAAQQQIDMQNYPVGLYMLHLPDGQVLKLQKL